MTNQRETRRGTERDRLKDVDPEFARLVSALRSNGPSKDALAKTLGAVASVASSSPEAASTPKSARLAMWVGAGAAVLALAAGGRAWMQSDEPRNESTPSIPAPAVPEQRPTSPDVPTSTIRVEDLPSAQIPAPTFSASAAKAPAKPQPSGEAAADNAQGAASDGFRDELALVERIRTQLSHGETAACLGSIDQYGERFRNGAFAQEVEVMRIEALVVSGDKVTARAAGERFIAQHPKSPYVERVRSVLDKTL